MDPRTPTTQDYSSHHGPPISAPMLSHSVAVSEKVFVDISKCLYGLLSSYIRMLHTLKDYHQDS